MACMAGLLTCVYILNHLPVFAALQRSIEGLDTASHFMEFVRVYGYIYLVWTVIAGYAVGPDTARDASPVLHRLVHHSALPCYSGAIVSTLTLHPCDIVVSSRCTSWTA
eukprot:scpid95519/ scgid0399/ 